jgi:hypothetical protein
MVLPDGAMIMLTTAVEADRTGKRYAEKIAPDEQIAASASGATDDPQMDSRDRLAEVAILRVTSS